jgi:hypothetical protein
VPWYTLMSWLIVACSARFSAQLSHMCFNACAAAAAVAWLVSPFETNVSSGGSSYGFRWSH